MENKKKLERIAKGVITSVRMWEFQVMFPKKTEKERFQIFKIEENKYLSMPKIGTEVICKYNSTDNAKIIEIYTFNGRLIYQEKPKIENKNPRQPQKNHPNYYLQQFLFFQKPHLQSIPKAKP